MLKFIITRNKNIIRITYIVLFSNMLVEQLTRIWPLSKPPSHELPGTILYLILFYITLNSFNNILNKFLEFQILFYFLSSINHLHNFYNILHHIPSHFQNKNLILNNLFLNIKIFINTIFFYYWSFKIFTIKTCWVLFPSNISCWFS